MKINIYIYMKDINETLIRLSANFSTEILQIIRTICMLPKRNSLWT